MPLEKFTLQSDGTYDYDVDLSNFNPDCASPSPNGVIAPGFRIYDENIGGGLASIDSIPVCASHVSGNISFKGFSAGDKIHFIYYDTHYSSNSWSSASYTFSDLVTQTPSITPTPVVNIKGTFDAIGKFTLQSNGTYKYDIDLSNFNPDCSASSPNGAISPGFRIYDTNYGGGIASIDSIPVCSSNVSGEINFKGFSLSDRIYFIYYDTNYANNVWSSQSYIFSDLVTVPLDTIPPDIIIQSPLGTASSQTVPISVSVTDTQSGIASYSYKIDGQMLSNNMTLLDLTYYNGGLHTFTVNATDKAGNSATKSSKFTYSPTTDTLTNELKIMYADGAITKLGTSLYEKVSLAQTYISSGNYAQARKALQSLVNQIKVQIDIHIDATAGNILISQIQYLMNSLPQ